MEKELVQCPVCEKKSEGMKDTLGVVWPFCSKECSDYYFFRTIKRMYEVEPAEVMRLMAERSPQYK